MAVTATILKTAGSTWKPSLKRCFKEGVLFLLLACWFVPGMQCPAEDASSGQSLEELCAAAGNGDAQSLYLLGYRYFDGDEKTGKDYKLAAEWIRKAAEKGHSGAQALLGYMYMTAYGVSADTAEGMGWLQKAAAQNDVSAQYYLGAFYQMGRGIEPDRFTAMDWYIKAAAQGHEAAKEALKQLRQTADQARQGTVSNEWYLLPLEQLTAKAEAGDAAAQESLGYRYKGYGGTEMDFEKALYWLEKSAARTNAAAHYHLSQLYVSTTNISPEKAFFHCSAAADGGHSLAQRTLGEYYRDGFGTKSDRGKALYWFRRAELSGDDRAAKCIYALIRGRAEFSGKLKRWSRQSAEDYSPPKVELCIRDLENKERTVRLLRYDVKIRQVETDYMFGASTFLPLSAFDSASRRIIQNETEWRIFEDDFDLEIIEKKLTRKECEQFDAISRRMGGTDFEYDGVIYSLKLGNDSDADLGGMDIEYRYFYEVKEIWRTVKPKQTSSQKSAAGTFKLENLKSGAEYEHVTRAFLLESSRISAGTYYINGAAEIVESNPIGLWVRVGYALADGTAIYRDFCEPSSLKSKVTWD